MYVAASSSFGSVTATAPATSIEPRIRTLTDAYSSSCAMTAPRRGRAAAVRFDSGRSERLGTCPAVLGQGLARSLRPLLQSRQHLRGRVVADRITREFR